MPSPLSQFKALIADPPRLIAQVVSSDGSVASVVQFHDGTTRKVLGIASVGASVFVRGDLIEGNAPSLPVVVIEV